MAAHFGCFVRALAGKICLITFRVSNLPQTVPSVAKDGFRLHFRGRFLDELTEQLSMSGKIDVSECFIDGSFSSALG